MDEQKPDEELQEEITEIESHEDVPVEEPAEPEKVESAPVQQELPKKLVEQPKQVGAPTPGKMERLKAFLTECKRVLRVTKKPDKQEFTTIVKISAIGMGVIGVVGFLVHFAKELLF